MWRQNTFVANADSDQSISDDEDFNLDLHDDNLALGRQVEKEEGITLQSRLDILRGTCELNCEGASSNLSPKRQIVVSLEDDVEMPDFPNDRGFLFSPKKAFSCSSGEQLESEHDEDFASWKQDGESRWFARDKETKALLCLDENPSSSSLHPAHFVSKQSCKGNTSKSKLKFSFHFQSNKEGLPMALMQSKADEEPEKFKTIVQGDYSGVNGLEAFHGNIMKQSESVSADVEDMHFCKKRSMAELLDGLQENTSLLRRSSKMHIGTTKEKVQAGKNSMSCQGNRSVDSEDFLEFGDSRSSSDNEVNQVDYQNHKVLVPELKKQTIADRFQEVLDASATEEFMLVPVSRPSGIGLFGRLHQVMQSEKTIDMEFLKLQFMTKPINEPSSIVVQILSRYLEAKLTVCRCCLGYTEDPQYPEISQTTISRQEKTVIFNSRVCNDVDLEVGNLIRIHSPWKEVPVGGDDESIILSAYFSQI